MPLVACPKCSTTLKIPDGASGNVKCPKCATVFPAAAKSAPAFEVVDDSPKSVPRKPAAKPEVLEPDFEVVDDPKPKKKITTARADDDDEDDRPRAKRRRDEDDDEYDRPRKKKGKKRRDYEDDDEEWQAPAKGSGSFGAAKVGMLMVSISLWIYLGTYALMALFLLIAWIGASIPNGLMILTGLLGLANWIVGLIGLGFCIAGPSKSRGLAIAATAVAAVHLIMAFVVANNTKSAGYGFHTIAMMSAMNKFEKVTDLLKKMEKETDPKRREALQQELRDLSESERRNSTNSSGMNITGPDLDRSDRRSGDDMRWKDLATLQPFSDQLIGILSYDSSGFSDYVLGLLSGLLEVARLILMILLVGSVAKAAKDRGTAEKAAIWAFVAGGAALAAMVVVVIAMAIIDNSKPTSVKSVEEATKAAKSMMTWAVLAELLVYAIHIGSLVMPALLAMQAKSAAAYRAR